MRKGSSLLRELPECVSGSRARRGLGAAAVPSSAAPFRLASRREVLAGVLRCGVCRVQFQQGEARCSDHAALLLLRNFLPGCSNRLARASEVRSQCLMIVVEKHCQLLSGYILKRHGKPLSLFSLSNYLSTDDRPRSRSTLGHRFLAHRFDRRFLTGRGFHAYEIANPGVAQFFAQCDEKPNVKRNRHV